MSDAETQQYFAIEAPHTTEAKEAGMSYVRMGNRPGKNESPEESEPGDKDVLVENQILGTLPSWEYEQSALHHSFITNETANRTGDDQGATDDQTPAGGTPEEMAKSWLHDVGWRDHAHGNRVSTTVGDKVEVITGNYKLVVLGHNPDASMSTGLDMSGGHTVNWAQTPGCIKRIESEDGGWRVTWSTERGNEVRVFEGTVYEHHVGGPGHSVCSFMGKGHPEMGEDHNQALDLIRDTAYSALDITEDFADEIYEVDAGYSGASFSEDAKGETPKVAAAQDITDHYLKANNIYEIKVTENLHEVVNATKVNVDYHTEEVVETWVGNYVEDFQGPSRKSVVNTDVEERDEHWSKGDIVTKYLCMKNRSEASVAWNRLDLSAQIGREQISTSLAMDFSFRSSSVMNDINFGHVKMDTDLTMLSAQAAVNNLAVYGINTTLSGLEIDYAAKRINNEETHIDVVNVIFILL